MITDVACWIKSTINNQPAYIHESHESAKSRGPPRRCGTPSGAVRRTRTASCTCAAAAAATARRRPTPSATSCARTSGRSPRRAEWSGSVARRSVPVWGVVLVLVLVSRVVCVYSAEMSNGKKSRKKAPRGRSRRARARAENHRSQKSEAAVRCSKKKLRLSVPACPSLSCLSPSLSLSLSLSLSHSPNFLFSLIWRSRELPQGLQEPSQRRRSLRKVPDQSAPTAKTSGVCGVCVTSGGQYSAYSEKRHARRCERE